ncbi:VanZ family protein [Niallia sp. 01092]|uniref:VanZ family protein n=1 Tax=unclassified Niallia TaxID=2837522 RepID=UPI003FCF3FCA
MLLIHRNLLNLLFFLSIIYILYLTMLPHPSLGIGVGVGGVNLIPFEMMNGFLTEQSLRTFFINVGGNIFLFVPFGFILPWRFARIDSVFRAALVGALFSTCIEITQLLITNRFTDIDDIILNTIGTVIGYFVYRLAAKEAV